MKIQTCLWIWKISMKNPSTKSITLLSNVCEKEKEKILGKNSYILIHFHFLLRSPSVYPGPRAACPCARTIVVLTSVSCVSDTRFSTSDFFHNSVCPGPLSIPVGPFRIFSRMNVYQRCQQHRRKKRKILK
jgi:hypothetical protein